MNKNFTLILATVIAFVFSSGITYPQDTQFIFSHVTARDGLPDNYVWSVIKDSTGFIWFTSRVGLCRYDGFDVRVYPYDHPDLSAFSKNDIKGNLMVDRDGNIWMGTLQGLGKFIPCTEKFIWYLHEPENISSISSNGIRYIYQDKSGTIWMGTTNYGGLNKYNPSNDTFTHYKQHPENSSVNNILSVYEDKRGVLWIGTLNGLFQFDRLSEEFIPVDPVKPLPRDFKPRYYDITEDAEGNIWFATTRALLNYHESGGVLTVYDPLLELLKQCPNCTMRTLEADHAGGDVVLWMRFGGLLSVNTTTDEITRIAHDPDDTTSIFGTTIKSIFRDDSGLLWITSERGINILGKKKTQIKRSNEFSDSFHTDAKAVLQDSKGNFWFGTGGAGIVHRDPAGNTIKWYKSLRRNQEGKDITGIIWSLYEDSEKNIWAGDNRNGLFFLDRIKDEFVYCEIFDRETGSKPVWIYDIYEESDSVIWFATNLGIYYTIGPVNSYKDITFHLFLNTGMYVPATSIHNDKSGCLWFGVQGTGVYCLPGKLRNRDSIIHYNYEKGNEKSLSDNHVWSICEDINHSIWIGTNYGLNKFNKESGEFKKIIFKNEPASNIIYKVQGDNFGNIWMTGENGLLRFNASSFEKYSEQSPDQFLKQFLTFDEISPYFISKSKSGEFFIGGRAATKNGYFHFHPDSIKENLALPSIIITDFLIHNEPAVLDSNITFKRKIVLSFKDNFFTLKFAAINYADPVKNQYAYYLEGLEEGWNYTGENRLANYTGVPPGDYIFRAKGSNNDGYWNEAGASIAITILPPLWRTWWAYTGYALIILGLLVLWRWNDLRRIRLRQQLELEHVEAEKLKELDSMKSRFFANISHEFRTPLTLILGPLEKIRSFITEKEAEEDLNMMQRNARRLQNLINQLLNLSKIESGQMKLLAKEENIVTLVNGYVQLFESLAKQKGIELSFQSDQKDIPLFVDKEKLENILYNLLSNAFKFTPEGGRIAVSVGQLASWPVGQNVRFDKEKLSNRPTVQLSNLLENCTVISITDTGSGIAPNHLDHIFDRFYQAEDSYTKDQEGTGIGLALVKELVELHHGKIRVESAVGAGTTFRIYLPLGDEHLRDEEKRREGEGEKGRKGEEENVILRSSDIIGTTKELVAVGGKEEEKGRKGDRDGEEPGTDKPLLLIVEDNDDLRSYIRSSMSDEYQIAEAIDGEKGLEKAIEKIPDLVISDVMMPVMDGYELCAKLKSDERTSHIPVILLTARASMESKIEGLEQGADDFITKPFDVLELQTRIRNLIEQRKKLQERLTRNIRRMGLENMIELEVEDMTSSDQKFMQKTLQIIYENLSVSNFDIEKLSSALALSRIQVHRKLKGLTGETPGSFIRQVRLNKAAEMLKSKTGTVSEIAYQVGFNNLSYFTKCFKEQFGVAPSEFSSTNFRS
jgi:signal transduction histidine kinase/DNA-binding response OmpR family regulator/ligand-binding sensor domain-containing protein